MRLAIAVAIVLCVCGVATVAAPLYVIVPFGEPGETDPVLTNATKQFSIDLAASGIRSAIAPPIDAVEAVGVAGKLCHEYSARGLLVPQLRFEQSKERNLTGFIPVVGGVISSSGAFDSSPIRARLKLFLIDCSGAVRWKTFTTTNKVHHGQNIPAGLTEITNKALEEAVDQFATRPSAPAH
ncbi:MAG TPA: hypothetical protein VE591_01100 [Candidatus Acidoferrum sp.]|nr:hypothetical protein [Candidatus Acidoferrum sp.]